MAGVRHIVTDAGSTAEARAARRGGILSLVLMPVLALVGAGFLALSTLTPVFIATGITLIVLAGAGIGLGVVALRGTGPLAMLRAVAAVAVIAGTIAVFLVGVLSPSPDNGATSIGAMIGSLVILVAAWALAQTIAAAVGKARRARRDVTA
jgi:hypothetical protein